MIGPKGSPSATGAGSSLEVSLEVSLPGGDSASARAKLVMDASDLRRALVRMAHQILESNRGSRDLVLVGIHRRGVPLAQRLGRHIAEIEGWSPPVGALDVSFYRDDVAIRRPQEVSPTNFPFDVSGKTVVLVDDVLFTGRTVRAAIDALVDFGRPRLVRLAVLVDRGHRELPIRADFIGKNIPTSIKQEVRVTVTESDGMDSVVVVDPPDPVEAESQDARKPA